LADLEDMQVDGLLQLREDGLEVLPAGRLMIRNVAMVFDEHLRKKAQQNQFSKVL